MIKSFLEYINEDSSNEPSSIQYAKDVINHIKEFDDTGGSYNEIRELEYTDVDMFDLVIQLKKESNPDFENDEHFKTLQWEEINFNNYGFAMDANTYMDNKDLMVPEIILTLIINPDKEPALYNELKFKLIDIIAHELNHTKQAGWNREPFNAEPNSKRQSIDSSYEYFLLPDEIESMVAGMYKRSQAQDIPLDKIFDKYLIPFVIDKKLSKEEYIKVFQVWIKHALENYPDVKLSPTSIGIQKIVKSM